MDLHTHPHAHLMSFLQKFHSLANFLTDNSSAKLNLIKKATVEQNCLFSKIFLMDGMVIFVVAGFKLRFYLKFLAELISRAEIALPCSRMHA